MGLLSAPLAEAAPSPLPGYEYEMVTPLSTSGQRAGITGLSDDGTRALVSSLGGFAGTPHLPDLGVDYDAVRGPAGWEIHAIAPPASQFPFIGTYSAWDRSADLRKTLWVVNTNDDVGTMRFTPIVREPDGVFQTVGPTLDDGTNTPAVVGSSEDLGRIVMSSRVRPPLTDGTIDGRGTTRASLIVSERNGDGTLSLRQVAYRAGATISPTCALTLGGPPSAWGSVSSDGAKIFFTTIGLSSCTNAAAQRVWAKVGTAEPIDLATSQCTTNCGTAQRAVFEGAAKDGSRVYFTTEQKLLDDDQDTASKNDLYEYDFDAAGNKLRSVTAGVAPEGAGVMRVSRVSRDGSRVYFVANGRALAPANARGVTPQPGMQNLYVYHRADGSAGGSVRFVAPLNSDDGHLWANDDRRFIQTSDDGRFALFRSVGDLAGDRVAGDTFGDLFHYDSETDELRRVWSTDVSRNGAQRVAASVMFGTTAVGADGGRRVGMRARNMTNDGGMVGFETAEPLDPADQNDQVDAYLWEADTGKFTLLTSGRSATPSRFQAINPTGETIMVLTSWPLLPQHTSGAAATFALRRGGGYPDNTPVPRIPCFGEDCQGPPGPPGQLPTLGGTQVFSGQGNEKPVEPPGASSLRASIVRPVKGGVARLTVRTPTKGTISVSGSGLRRTSRAAGSGGRYVMTVRLTAKARAQLARKGRLTARATVRLTPSEGKVSSVKVTLRFAAKAKRGARTAASAARTTDLRPSSTEKER